MEVAVPNTLPFLAGAVLIIAFIIVPLGSMAKWQPTDEVGSLASCPTPIMTMSGLEPAPGR